MKSKKGVVPELLIALLLLGSVIVLTMTFTGGEDVPNIQKKTFDAITELRDLIAQGLLNWLAAGVSPDPLACNWLYPLSDNLEDMEGDILPYIENVLPGGTIDGDGITIDLGTITGVDFIDDDTLQVIMEGGTIIFDDGTIYADDDLDEDMVFAIRLPMVLRVMEDWVMCDMGDMSGKLLAAFGDWCFFGKRKIDCGNVDALSVSADDIDYIMDYATPPSRLVGAIEESVGELNAYFRGESTCNEPMLDGDSGIVCDFVVEELDQDYLMKPYITELDIARNLPPSYDLARYRGDSTHVWALPPTIYQSKFTDTDLDCPPEPVPPDTRVAVPEGPTYDPMVELATQGSQPVLGSLFGTDGIPSLWVNTTKSAKFTIAVKCTDNSNSLLGQPITYKFFLKYGLQQQCGPPSEVINTRDEPVCFPCGVAPQVEMKECEGGTCKGCYVGTCESMIRWSYLYEDPWLNTRTLADFDTQCGVSGGGPIDVDTYCTGPPYNPSESPEECVCDLLYERQQVACARDREPPWTRPCGCSDIKCCASYLTVCCAAYGYKEDGTTCGPDSPECFMNYDDYKSLCTGPNPCDDEPEWQPHQLCVPKECTENPSNPEERGCFPVDDSTSIAYGEPCGDDDSGCWQCRGEDEPLAGYCELKLDVPPDEYCREDDCVAYKCEDPGGCVSQGLKPEVIPGETTCGGSNECGAQVCVTDFGGYCSWELNDGMDGQPCGQGVVPFTHTCDDGDPPSLSCTRTYTCERYAVQSSMVVGCRSHIDCDGTCSDGTDPCSGGGDGCD